MNAIPLNVLISAVDALAVAHEILEMHGTTAQYMQVLSAWSVLRVHVDPVVTGIKIEVQA